MSIEDMECIIEILEASIKRNGSVPLTTTHLKNILKMAVRLSESEEEKERIFHEELYAELGDKWGSD
jgi:hypothetical protein